MKDSYHDLYITPISPIHMGTGDEYDPTNYVIDDCILYEFDSLQAMRVLSPQSRKDLDKITKARADQTTLKNIQKFFYSNRDRIKTIARRHVRVNESVQQFYQSRIGQTAQHEGRGSDVFNKMGINRAAWNPVDNKNYLPGSGIKGAIRTALLDSVNNGREHDKAMLRERNGNRKLQETIFKGSFHTDPMRLVSISDSQAPEANILSEVVFEINKKKSPVKDKQGNLRVSSADKGDLNSMLETIAPFQPRLFKTAMYIKTMGAQSKDIPRIQFSPAEIAIACNRYYLPILQKEIDLLKRRGFIDSNWEKQVNQVIESDTVQNNRAFLLRVGRHSGAESVTLNGVRNIKIMQGKGNKPKYQDQTTTIWLANDHQKNERNLVPFGWLLIDMAEAGTDQTTLPNLNMPDKQQWFKELEQQKAKMQEQIEKELEKENEVVQRSQQAKKEAEQKAIIEQQKIAALSPIEREIHDIEANDPSGNPAMVLMQFIKSGKWDDEDDISQIAKRIKTLLEDKGDWMPDFTGSNKQKLKKKNRCLEIMEWIKN